MATSTATASLQRRALSVFGTNVLVLVIGYIGSITLARFLGAEGRGLVAVILIATAVLAGLGGVGTHEAATYYASRRAHRRKYVLGNGLVHAACLLVVSLTVAFLLMGELQSRVAPDYDERIWLLAGLLVPSYYVYDLVSSMLSAETAFKLRNQLNVTARIATTVALLFPLGVLLGMPLPGGMRHGASFKAAYRGTSIGSTTGTQWWPRCSR